MFLSDYNIDKSISKDSLWLELLNHGYSLGDRILNFSNPVLKGSDVEELQELLSRLGFYSEPINSEYSQELMKSVEAFQENRGLTIDGVVGLNTATEIKKLIRPNLDNSLNEAIKGFKPPGSMLNVCIYVENVGDYKEQVIFYESLKESGNKSGVNVSFASEAGEDLSQKTNVPIFAYQVSGEYSMLKMGIDKKIFDHNVIPETLISLFRAGSSSVITYFARWTAENYDNIS